MQGMWFILAAALLTQLLWEVPSITCTVPVVILSIIIPTCWGAAVGLISSITPPLTPPTPISSLLTTISPQKRVKGLGETIDSLLLQTSEILTLSQLFTSLPFFLLFHFIIDSDLHGTNSYFAHLPYGGDSNELG